MRNSICNFKAIIAALFHVRKETRHAVRLGSQKGNKHASHFICLNAGKNKSATRQPKKAQCACTLSTNVCLERSTLIDCNMSRPCPQTWSHETRSRQRGWFIHRNSLASQTVGLCVNRCWPRQQTTNHPPPPSSHTHLTDGLSSNTLGLQICPGPKGILGTKGGGLGCVRVRLGVQNLDTKGVPAASDKLVNAAGAGALSSEGAARTSGRTQGLTFSLLWTLEVSSWTWPAQLKWAEQLRAAFSTVFVAWRVVSLIPKTQGCTAAR